MQNDHRQLRGTVDSGEQTAWQVATEVTAVYTCF